MTIKTILFDLDGTLIDSAPDVCGALNRTLSKIGRRAHSIEETTDYLGHGAETLMEMALANTGDSPDAGEVGRLTKEFLADYAQNPIVDSTIFPGVVPALTALRGMGFRLAICTNKPGVTAMPVLQTLDLMSCFDAVVCADQVEKKKPDGGHVLDTIAAVGGTRDQAVLVGDSENDIAAAQDAGIPSILVTFGYAQAPHRTLGADVVVDSFADVQQAALQLFRSFQQGTVS